MKTKILLLNLFFLLSLLVSCDKQEVAEIEGSIGEEGNLSPSANLPDGYFEVRFTPKVRDIQTKAPVSGADPRVQHIRYIVYKLTGEYVKEKVILSPSQGIPTWPLGIVKDTLPNGEYKAVFLGNVEKTLFPYEPSSSFEVLTNHQTYISNALIHLPPVEFTANTEYYWAEAAFSTANPNPGILLQRIIGGTKLQRVLVDADEALDSLVSNIVTQIGYEDVIRNTLEEVLPGELREVISSELLGVISVPGLVDYVDELVNPLVDNLVEPIVEVLYEQLLESLVAQLGNALVGNTDKQALVEYLGVILNPWNNSTASNAVVTINNYPKSIGFDLIVRDSYSGDNQFMYGFNTDAINQERYILLKNFDAAYNVQKINVVGAGLVGGVVVDQVIDEFLLSGPFVDINDPIIITGEKYNRRYQAFYSLASLGLKSYDYQTGGSEDLTLTIQLGNIANIDGILGPVLNAALESVANLLGPILGAVLRPLIGSIVGSLNAPLRDITVSVPLNLPLLGIDNLNVSGSWGPVTTY